LGWTTKARAGGVEVFAGCRTVALLGYDWDSTLPELAFGNVEGSLKSWSRTADDASFTIVGAFLGDSLVLDVELSVDVP